MCMTVESLKHFGFKNAGSIRKCSHCYFECFYEFDKIQSWTQELFGVVDSEAKDGDEEGGSGCWRVGIGSTWAAQDQVQEVAELSSHEY